ncbi:MAG TPA: hypothetical protein VFW98_05025 [Gemmatimonadaceae bacterium]|nr:hypothetical protein [Gemmatimonadaceae bacterium]
MPLVPLYGHLALRRRLAATVARGALPGSLLIQGPRGIGKQRLALWLGQYLLCTEHTGERPCGQCQSCRFALALGHPDLRWFFPRPRLADGSAAHEQVLDDYAEALAGRAKSNGLYAAPSGMEGIFVATVRTIVTLAAYTPTLGARKVFILGDAERMVPQEGADQAANAFLKLLEEPPADTTLILTSSEPGALLPTIRSRVVTLRATSLPDADVRAFLADPAVRSALEASDASAPREDLVRRAAGRPGSLFGAAAHTAARTAARALVDAASASRAEQMRVAMSFGGSRSRGFFSDVLDSVTVLLHERAQTALRAGDEQDAMAAARAIDRVEHTKRRATGNVSPPLLSAALIHDLTEFLR